MVGLHEGDVREDEHEEDDTVEDVGDCRLLDLVQAAHRVAEEHAVDYGDHEVALGEEPGFEVAAELGEFLCVCCVQ